MDTAKAVRRTLGALLLIGSLSAVACSPSSSTAAPTTIPPVVHSDPAGKFSAELPNAPFREESTVKAAGLDLLIVSYTTETATESLVVGYTDYPKSVQLAKVLDGAAQG